MSIKLPGRYDPGSDQDRAHKLLKKFDVEVDHVYGVHTISAGMEEITFTHRGKAQTAWAENGAIVHVLEGWDVLPPKTVSWREGY